MPVITIATIPHPEERDLLESVADAVADELQLAPGDVIAMSIPARATAVNGAESHVAARPWALISIHGSDRGVEAMQRACASAQDAAADWSRRHAVDQEGVWCEWLLPQHP